MLPTPLRFRLPKSLAGRLMQMARDQDTTPSAVIRAALYAYLYREASDA